MKTSRLNQSHPTMAMRHGVLAMLGVAALSTYAQAWAQEATAKAHDETNLEEITVTGQRAALIRAEDIKKEAIGVVDSVSAEEAGKFPDANVADSLQRVPGLSIDRSGGPFSTNGGESSQVTIRGFGPNFNNVLLNGRTLPSYTADRSFSFDLLPSEVISTAEVYKTSSAEIAEGGIGGTVNVITARPLDQKGFYISGSAAGVNDSVTGMSSKVTPKASALFGWTNDERTFGWLVSGFYSKRDDNRQFVSTEGWITGQNLSNINPAYTSVAIPQDTVEGVYNESRTRQGFSAAIDWVPVDSVKVKFDTLLSNYKVNSTYNRFDLYGNVGDTQTLNVDSNGTALHFTRYNQGVLANDYVEASVPKNAYVQQTGLNLAWDINDSTRIDLDVAASQAWNKDSADSYFAVLGTRNYGFNPAWTNNGSAVFPDYNPSTYGSTTDTSNLHVHCCQEGGYEPNVTDRIIDTKLQLEKKFDDQTLSRLDIGGEATNRVKTQEEWITPNSSLCSAYCGYVVPVSASTIGASIFNAGSPVVNGLSPGLPTQWIGYNPYAYFAYLASPAAINQLPAATATALRAALAANGGTFAAAPEPSSYGRVQEKIYSAYGKVDFKGSLWDKPWTLDAGLRYSKTDTTANAYYDPLTGITVNPNDTSNSILSFGSLSPISSSSSYGDWLPSANFKLSLRNDLIFRLGLSKTVTRPDLSDLAPSTVYTARPTNLTDTTGNTALKPYSSKNVDVGLEWYINETSYIAAEGFYKDVSNFITSIETNVTILGHPFLQTEPVNLNAATIKGAEFAVNYQFSKLPSPFDGLGTALNYTLVSSDASINPALINTSKFAIPGIGDSANASGYYEKGPFQARLAYNWRGRYLSTIAGDEGQPTTVKAYGQLDLSSSYKVNDHLSAFIEAANLTRSVQVWYQVYPNRLDYAEKDGMTLTVGVHGKW